MKTVDVCIIGAGVVGCAIARDISEKTQKTVAIVEKNACAGEETSSKNSGVLHTGFHQKPGSLKAQLSFRGSGKAILYAYRKGIPILHTGMLIAIPKGWLWEGLLKEWKALLHLLARGRAQKTNFSFVTEKNIREREPYIRASCGIFIPDVWVIDSAAFVHALLRDAVTNGAAVHYKNPVIAILADASHYIVTTERMKIRARVLINAAGLYADTIANLALGEKRYVQYPWRGEYYEIVTEKKNLVRGLVYPAMPSSSAGKGIHFSPRPDGRMYLGPNATYIGEKTDSDTHKTPPENFLAVAKKFLPCLEEKDLRWAYAGIRPKLSQTPREDDFIISVDTREPTLINCIGIESPGLSASVAIAEYVSNLLSNAEQRYTPVHRCTGV